MSRTWIDFKTLRRELSFETILKHYRVEIKRKGDQHHGFCPLPLHEGKRNSQSFSANLAKGIFQCFGCGAKGNQLDFAVLMEGLDPGNGSALREIALKLKRELLHGGSLEEIASPRSDPVDKTAAGQSNGNQLRAVNMPLDFELKDLDAHHRYLLDRGFTRDTIKHFGLGYCSRGLLKDRVAIALHDRQGRLIGYAGRVVDESLVNEGSPRYRFPGERTRGNILLEFRKTLFLYNGFRINAPVEKLIVVEGFTSVWWLTQLGLPNVVATMGADCSEKQADLIVELVSVTGHVWVISDGDKAGTRHAESVLSLVAPHRFVRWVKLPDGKQPTDYKSAKELLPI